MFKSNLIRKTVKIVAIGTICLSLMIPSAVNAAHDVYKPEKTVVPICDFKDATDDNLKDYASPEYVNEGPTVSVSLDGDDKDKRIKVTTKPKDNGGSLDNSYFVLKKDQSVSLYNEQAPYLVFKMKASAPGNAEMKFNINTPPDGVRYHLNKNAVLERSKDFSDSNEKVEEFFVTEGGAFSGNFLSNTEYYEYRLNLKQALGEEAYTHIGEWWGIAISIYNWAHTDYYYDNFRLESGNGRSVYQTFDGISNVNDVAWYRNGFSASIENLGYLNSPALKLTGRGEANTQIVFDGGHTVNLLANGHYLYWYMDVDVDTDAAGFNYKPEFVNACIKILTESWKNNEGLIWDDTKITYAGSLSGVLNGAGTPLPDWNGNEWALRLPVGKHWFRIDLTKAFKSDYTEEAVKESLSKATALYLQYNCNQEDEDGHWDWKNFGNVNADFIIDSISTSVKDFDLGDADGNGVIDILDLVTVNDCIKGIYQPVVASADTNGDNKLDDYDLAGIRKIILNQSL